MTPDQESLDKMERRVREGLPPDDQFLVDAFKEGLGVDELLRTDGGRALMVECINTGKAAFARLMDPGATDAEERRALHQLRVSIGMLRMMSTLIGAGLAAERGLTSADADLSL